MFPVGDQEVRGAGPALVTWALILLNVIVFLFEATMSQSGLESFIQQYGVVPAQISQGNQLYTLLTSMFLHGGWLHLIGNMLFLWVFGDNIEVVLGHIGYIIFYLLGGLAASFLHIVFNLGSSVPSVGASGAIAALMGAYIVMFPGAQVKLALFMGRGLRIARTTALVFIGLWAVMQLFNGVASLGVPTAQTAGVAYWAHIGGFAVGLLVGFMFRTRASSLALERPS
jgi:membrane associated rhomboid family serine protease